VKRNGYSLAEAIASLAVLAAAILLSAGLLARRQALTRQLDERAVAAAWASSRMAEALAGDPPLHAPWTRWSSPESPPGAKGVVMVEPWGRGIVKVSAELTWPGGRVVRETLAEAP
jgi:hypothetical protein